MASFAPTASNRTRAAAFGLAAATVAAFGSSTAFAKEPIAPACRSAGSEIAQLRCSTAVSKRATAAYDAQAAVAHARGVTADARTAAANERLAAADARIVAEDKRTIALKKSIETADASKSCYDNLTLEVRAAKRLAPLTPDQKNAFRARAAQCDKS